MCLGCQQLETPVCVYVCVHFPRERQSCVSTCRIRGSGRQREGDHRSGAGYQRDTRGLRVRYWNHHRFAQAPRETSVYMCTCICAAEGLTASNWTGVADPSLQPHEHPGLQVSSQENQWQGGRGWAEDGPVQRVTREALTFSHSQPSGCSTSPSWARQRRLQAGDLADLHAWGCQDPRSQGAHSQPVQVLFSQDRRRSKNLKQRWPHKGRPDMEDTGRSSSALQYCTA